MTEANQAATGVGSDRPPGVTGQGKPSDKLAAVQQLMERLNAGRGGVSIDPILVPYKAKVDYIERELQRLHETIRVKAGQPHLCLDDDNAEINEVRERFTEALEELTDKAEELNASTGGTRIDQAVDA